jgi:hypothetical protein
MTTPDWSLGDEASLLDRITLRVFRRWQTSGRDFTRAYFLTQLTLAAILVVPLTAVPTPSAWNPVGAVAALVAPITAWTMHRRRYGWRAPAGNRRAVKWGISLGVLLFLVTGVLVMVVLSYVGIAISMLSPQGPLVLIPAVGTGLLGWLAAARRKRRLDDPIYPVSLSGSS